MILRYCKRSIGNKLTSYETSINKHLSGLDEWQLGITLCLLKMIEVTLQSVEITQMLHSHKLNLSYLNVTADVLPKVFEHNHTVNVDGILLLFIEF